MKTLFGLLVCFLCAHSVCGQRTLVRGKLMDASSRRVLEGAHIKNEKAGLLTSSDPYGRFNISATQGDTLLLSRIGYKTMTWIVEPEWEGSHVPIDFYLTVDTVYLEEVVVGEFPHYDQFKEQILEMQENELTFARLPTLGKKRIQPEGMMGVSISGPFSAIHNWLGKEAKEKRKMKKIMNKSTIEETVRLKFTPEWIEEVTGLQGDTLTAFIAYCNFSDQYIAESPLYLIYEKMNDMLPQFLSEYR